MKRIRKAVLCIILVLTMVLPLTACQKKGKETATIDKNTVYKEELLNIKLPSGFEVNNCVFKNDKAYFCGYTYNQSTGESGYAWGTVKLDGSDLKINNLESQNSWIDRIMVDDDGNIYLVYSETKEDDSDPENYIYESSYYLK